MTYYHLGSLRNPAGPFRQLLKVGNHGYLANFENGAKAGEFTGEYMTIKREAQRHHDELHSGEISQEVYEDHLKTSWIPLINAFIEKWGISYVPGDVRKALTSVEKGIGLPETKWPPIAEIEIQTTHPCV